MKRTIVNPHWVNNARTVLSAEFHYDDGRIVNAVISDSDTSNPDLAEIIRTFDTDTLEQNTRRNIQKITADADKKRIAEEAQEERRKQEELFAAKLKIFEIDGIKNSTNRDLKSRIRRSKSDVEAMAWASALLLSEAQKEAELPPAE